MGIQSMFGDEADFSGFSRSTPIKIHNILHTAKINIDEEGTIASAGTLSTVILISGYIEFKCNHPFIFMIHDQINNEILFSGIYRRPN